MSRSACEGYCGAKIHAGAIGISIFHIQQRRAAGHCKSPDVGVCIVCSGMIHNYANNYVGLTSHPAHPSLQPALIARLEHKLNHSIHNN